MGRKKGSLNKKFNVQQEVKHEETMTETETLETPVENSQALETIESEIDQKRLELEKLKLELEEKQAAIRDMGRRDYDKKEIEISQKQISAQVKNAGLKDKIEQQKAYDSEMVTGRFMNRRAPGQSVKLTYLKYADDPVKWYFFEDNKVYTIPRGFADQLNEHYYTPSFTQKQGEMDPNRPSSAIHEVDTSNKKYAFVAVNY